MLNRRYLTDLAERVIATYLEAFVGLLLVAPALDIDAVTAALVAAIPAALSIVKGALSAFIGQKGTASALPREPR